MKEIESLLNEYKYLPFMIKSLYIDLSYMETTGELSTIREFKKKKKVYEDEMLKMDAVLDVLTDEERQIIQMNYIDIEKISRKEIAEKLGKSMSYYCKIRKTALEKIGIALKIK